MMAEVDTAGESVRPVIDYPGKQLLSRIVNGVRETVHSYPLNFYFYQRDNAGVDSGIFVDWATKFIEGTSHLLDGGNKLLLLLDSYTSHIQRKVLQMFEENDVIIVGLSLHT